MPKKILITGSLGLVGSEAMKFFKEKGWKVCGIDSNMRNHFFGTPKKNDDESLDIDIRNKFDIDQLFEATHFDAILHAASQPSHDYAKDHVLEDFDTNSRGTLILLEAARKYCPKTVFVHISTDKVYGENMSKANLIETATRYHHEYPFDEYIELDLAGHRSFFGVSKTAADLYVQEYGAEYGMKTVCFRCGCITGKNHEGAKQHGFLAYLAKCIREEQPYNILGFKGKQVRDIIHAYDLITACYIFVENPKIGAVYNMGGGPERSLSVLEAINAFENATGKKGIINIVEKEREGDRQWDVHDVAKFRKDYPEWDYKYNLQDIIKELCEI